MEKENFISALLAKGKNAMGVVKTKVANLIADKSLLDIAKLEHLVPDLGLKDRLMVAKSINLDILFKAKKYDLLIRLEQFEEMINRGLGDEIIARYPKFREELGKENWAKVNALITEPMLDAYLKKSHENFDFFIWHPLGLKVLAENEFTGFIAAREKEFRHIAENFPDEFRMIGNPNHRREYNALLKKFLD